ncbi:arylsulfatase [Botrimarina mediterranea]|uniref:Arylsulfatase n=1 Tax=Botrimarina mediterranea TaxID=2528022 RepID=A0A518K4M9_9BACT|nr:arylsulfatase [Botrimarina mediterranea]QDV72754.1 Arylsulfatase [Botrimarina mediterranea]QDV77328.1 Arylsulfatase [Planctomycetes bacterium K2D]
MRLLALALLFCSFASINVAADRLPNIVFVLADDLGYGDLSCFGQQRFTTPRLDELAARGMKLTQHYAGSTVCAPSRCALMTGLHTGHCAVRGNRERQPEGQEPMPGDAVTMADLLKRAGYATGAFGKWGLGYPGSESDPLRSGFDEFFGYNCQRHAHRYYTDYLWDGDRRIDIESDVYTHDLIFDRALDFIRDHQDGPFFCFLPVTLPHAAMEAPEEDRAPFRQEFAQFENNVGKYAGAEVVNPIASFPAMVRRLDGDVGRLVDLLGELGIDDNTIVVFTSDNGPHREGGHDPEFFDSNGPLRGHKRDLYEGGVRAPTIVSWPGHVAAGVESDILSAGWDWLPTFCELAGDTTPGGLDGVSLAPTLTGAGEQQQHAYLYWEFHEQGGKQAVRRGPWKAVRLGANKNPHAAPELYNLDNDPGETTNLAESEPAILAELVQLMAEAHRPAPSYGFGTAKR